MAKILYVTDNNGLDYLNNLIFHGLVSLGDEVLDTSYQWYLSPIKEEQRKELYGLGFSIAGILPDRSNINRNPVDILEMIKDHYFDIVIYGSIHRCINYWDLVLQIYKKNEIIFLDGEDEPYINMHAALRGIYFKRELSAMQPSIYNINILPISFSIPREKFITVWNKPEKINFTAPLVPGDKSTYIYDNEKDYYNNYTTSYFGETMRKNGWDCLRHYEIIASYCLPYFKDYPMMPRTIMTNWPNNLQVKANILFNECINERIITLSIEKRYYEILNEFYNYAISNLTTTAAAKYILNKL